MNKQLENHKISRAEFIQSQVASLYMQHWTEIRISEHLEITLQEVYDSIAIVSSSWALSQLKNKDGLLALELAKLNSLENIYADEWRASRKPTDVVHEDGSVTMGHMPGDIQYLKGIYDCIGKRCSLLGLDVRAISIKDEGGGGGLAALLGDK